MKKILLGLLLLGTYLFGSSNVLYVYNWSEYLPAKVIKQFEKESGIKVKYSTYDSNEAMYAKIKTDKKSSYDIIVPSTYFVSKMAKEGLLAPIDKTKLPNFVNLDKTLLYKPFDPKNDYSIPYLWGSTGVSYNSALLGKNAVTSWGDLWNPKYKKSVLLTDDLREVFGMTLKVLGYSANDTDPKHIEQAYQKLLLLRPNVKVFNSESPKQVYLSEEVKLGMNFNGENYMANKESPDLKYVYPKEGIMLWVDSLVIPKNSQNIDNAHKFINFILRPEIGKIISEEIGYASPNAASVKLLPKAVQANRIIYPIAQDLTNSEFQTDIGSAVKVYEKYWERFKAGK
ncbi:MAG: extracellular solute-binding protein [Sulfuricurvum sp.]|uniref:extracellular solute-binding protein n=1 Tax=Sulfuricurvum sp. TaxID=2025608 RepID=UPI00260779A8|nr:extracellular solute-binding protein [Sulfuricurvum sp.]MDD2830226.1 extracellular solute-binding protein [Sulfuricurvum sp.]MDD4950004.1 extracellular solute-binding protein [Sulfuricurvum sp.]